MGQSRNSATRGGKEIPNDFRRDFFRNDFFARDRPSNPVTSFQDRIVYLYDKRTYCKIFECTEGLLKLIWRNGLYGERKRKNNILNFLEESDLDKKVK